MAIPFNMGDPVQLGTDPNRVGKVIGLIEPTYDSMGVPTRLAQVVVQPPLKKYTSTVYYVEELIFCRCANRGAGIKRSVNPCEKSVPF
jgi:hypothetical protein